MRRFELTWSWLYNEDRACGICAAVRCASGRFRPQNEDPIPLLLITNYIDLELYAVIYSPTDSRRVSVKLSNSFRGVSIQFLAQSVGEKYESTRYKSALSR